jgi:phage gpG-like protein
MAAQSFDLTFKLDPTAMVAAFERLDHATRGEVLGSAVMAGALVLVTQIVENIRTIPSKALRRAGQPIWDTGNLGRSITSQPVETTPSKAVVHVGTDVEYARRVEYGFSGMDSLGRRYNQPPNPYMRPAFDSKQEEASDTMGAAFRELIVEEVQSLGAHGGRRSR